MAFFGLITLDRRRFRALAALREAVTDRVPASSEVDYCGWLAGRCDAYAVVMVRVPRPPFPPRPTWLVARFGADEVNADVLREHETLGLPAVVHGRGYVLTSGWIGGWIQAYSLTQDVTGDSPRPSLAQITSGQRLERRLGHTHVSTEEIEALTADLRSATLLTPDAEEGR